MRELKGLEIAARSRIIFDDGAWNVPSQAGHGGKYRVVLTPTLSCTCEDFSLHQKACKHVHAARLVQERDHGGQAPVVVPEVAPKRPTYKQSWGAYNEAQINEKHRLQVLLHDLCRNVTEPLYKGGRRPTPMGDAIFACAFKTYTTLSSRRFGCDLKDAFEKGYMTKSFHPNKVNAFLEDEELTPRLHALIRLSALPLAVVEKDFAVDSSGFSSSRFVRWYDEKYGVHRSGHDWVKAHMICGVKTNVITAVEILDKNAADSPQFGPLVKATAENFSVREVSGDKAYGSVDNFQTVADCGGTAFIAFKANATGAAGGLYEKMFHYFQFRRDEFLTHYHKRSNAESTFSMIKAKFRDHVRSRTDVAMKNEVLCKILCHNLCCVILAQCELGIEAVFWKDEEKGDDRPDVLPLVRPG